MKDEKELENKSIFPPSNKGGKVKVKINHNRAVAGGGKADEVVTVSEQEAQRLVARGLATIVKEK